MIPTRSLASLALRPGLSFAARTCLIRPARSRIAPGLLLKHRAAQQRAWETTSATTSGQDGKKQVDVTPREEQESGKFDVKSNEAILFFDNIFPLKLSFLLSRRSETDYELTELLRRYNSSTLGLLDPIQLVKRAIPESLPIKVTEIMPRLKDGGAYVKFQYDATLNPKDIEATLLKKLKEQPIKPWFNPFRGIKARLIRGTPWLEDLYRFPSSYLLVEFVPPEPGTTPEELPEEIIYSMFRRYGKIADIIPQPSDSKTTPRFANVSFPFMRDAIMARNCMHGYVLSEALGGGKNGTKLRLSYIRRAKTHSTWNWITSHPRIIIPIVAALLAGLSVMVFDPIRQFFVRVHVQHSLRFTNWKIYKWFKSRTSFSFGGKKKHHVEGLDTVWKHRRDLIDQLQSWLDGSSGTFIVVTGPRGSGKTEMVMDQALAGRKNVLLIDCKPITEAGGESSTIKRLAANVGYRPVFSWANSISSMIDLAIQSTTGVKSGFTETFDSQLHKILLDKDASLSEDAYLEAHPEKRPVIVIDNYLHKNEETGVIYEKLAEWAATVVQNNIAHVVFLTNDSSYNKPLSKAMPDRVFRTLAFSDLDLNLARNFVISRLEEDWKREAQESEEEATENVKPIKRPDLSGLDVCIQTLGGRLADLEFLARRLKTGQNPKEAVEEIVNENATDIVKMFLLGKPGDGDRKWSTQQAWHLIKALAENEKLRYNQILLLPTFASSTTAAASNGEAAIESLASTELISVTTHRGRPQTIKAGKPLHQASFGVLLQDRVLRAKMDLALMNEVIKVEAKSIEALENELQLLGRLPRHTGETAGRVMYLLGKLDVGQGKIDKLERDIVGLKKILNEEF
ncbi:Mitochondrial escape protein 2 [Cladobotryum mycophilum]|uniref:Mitochondrial escape protein 2 n=1 Tax=Cladobotryum mycophilum TaxID=491253 RepID=A0ABR0T0Z0_9HYPO